MIMSDISTESGSAAGGIDQIRHIVIVGAGAMGSQIGMLCALAGFEATITDLQGDALDRANHELRQRLTRDIEKGRRTQDEVDVAFGRLEFSTDVTTAATTADYVIEAAVEKLDVKRQLFADLDRLTPPPAILATNSSSIVSSRIADATGRPDRVCNMHFFNPALVMKCVEVVRGPDTSDETVQVTVELARRLGKVPVVLNREIPGFIANRILGAVRDEAIFLLENGIASVEDIDTACRTALGYPMGPFELMDLTGIDIGYLTKKDRFAASGDPKDQPSRSVSALVERGELGRKTGRGWYEYDQAGTKTPRPTEQVTSS
jgi:3-hydroxybutyryl-CoA dehydrogenase